MKNSIEKHARGPMNPKRFLISLLIGGLASAAIMLLFVPQSGRQTWARFYQRSILMGNRAQTNHLSSTREAVGVLVKAIPMMTGTAFLPMGDRGSKIRRSSLLQKMEGQLLTEELLANDSLGG